MKILLIFIILMSSNVFAQHLSDYNVFVDLRENHLSSTEVTRLQGRIRLGFTIDVNGVVEIIGLASTGSSYNREWSTVASSNNSVDRTTLAFRNIYMRKVIGETTLEAGALRTDPSESSLTLAASGWIDGMRVKVNSKIGEFKVVAGSLGDFNQTNAFERKFKGNFVEIEMDHKIFENLLSQTFYDNYNGDSYVRERLKLDLKLIGEKVIKVFSDTLYDIDRRAFNYELGAEFDVLKTIINKYDHRLDLRVYYSDISSRIPDSNLMISGFYIYGPRTTVQLSGKIDKAGNLSWFTRASLTENGNNRYDAGVQLRIPKKKKSKIKKEGFQMKPS
jgi:hypothetical protein